VENTEHLRKKEIPVELEECEKKPVTIISANQI
jgi:hypothetical protein